MIKACLNERGCQRPKITFTRPTSILLITQFWHFRFDKVNYIFRKKLLKLAILNNLASAITSFRHPCRTFAYLDWFRTLPIRATIYYEISNSCTSLSCISKHEEAPSVVKNYSFVDPYSVPKSHYTLPTNDFLNCLNVKKKKKIFRNISKFFFLAS